MSDPYQLEICLGTTCNFCLNLASTMTLNTRKAVEDQTALLGVKCLKGNACLLVTSISAQAGQRLEPAE